MPLRKVGAAFLCCKLKSLIKIALLLAVVSACLFGYILNSKIGAFRECETTLLSVQWMLLVCIVAWCGTFLFLTFNRKDLLLIGLLLIAIAMYFIGEAASSRAVDALILLAGVTLGRGTRFFVGDEVTSLISKPEKLETRNQSETPYVVSYFLVGLVVLLAFSSWWHLDMAGAYHGPRWMGLWDNPNIYGMLMGVGFVLAVGLFALTLTLSHPMGEGMSRGTRALLIFLFIAAGMMGVGLFFSYSRGAWAGTAVGLLYLAKAHGKLKWRWVMLGAGLLALGILLFWGRTADNGPWYLKRLDFSRPSAQHRVSAWRGALQMMRDHPLGVGWNKAVETYDSDYSPPKGGAAALTMNSYLMLGTELGLPGLLCFVAYVGLALKQKSEVRSHESESLQQIGNRKSEIGNRTACRAGAIVLLVAFWFDGGLFDLPTASVFWILLELGTSDLVANRNCGASSSMNE
jgi:hypothetical protein